MSLLDFVSALRDKEVGERSGLVVGSSMQASRVTAMPFYRGLLMIPK
jgi:hypothetical protein